MRRLSQTVVAIVAVFCFGKTAFAQSHFSFTSGTGNNATVIVPTSANPNIAGTPLASGDEIGVFTPGGLCVGAVVWSGSSTAIAIWGASTAPPMPGIQSGEAMSYRVWRQSTNTEFSSVSVSYSSAVPATQWDGLYHQDGLYVLSTLFASAGAASKLGFGQQPTNTVAGASISPTITVQIQDAGGNLVTTETRNVTLAIGSNPGGGTLSGTATVAAVGGIATFSGLSINKAGAGYTLVATSSPVLTGVTSSSFNILAGIAAKYIVTSSSYGPVAGANVTITAQLSDASSNPVSTAGKIVTWSSTNGGSFGTTTSTTNGSGIATVTFTTSSTAGTVHTVTGTDNTALTGTSPNITTAASAPTVVTVAASSVTLTSAQLNGTVNPNGASTTYYFEYGTSTSYGTQTSSAAAGSGTSAVSVNAAVSALTPGTLYHYRVVATNSLGTSQGGDLTFTTTIVAPTVTTLAASGVTSTSAQVNGTINPNGAPTTYYFEYGTTTSYGTQSSSTSAGSGTSGVGVNAALSTLTPGTQYHYRVVATNSAGTSQGGDLTFTTTAVAPTVTTSAASGVTSNSAQLNGSVNPNGVSTTYYFEYGTTTSYGSQTSSTAAGSGTGAVSVNAAIGGLTPYLTYHYRVVATNSGGTSQGSDMSFTTSPLPPTVTTLDATGIGATTAQLNGTVNPNGVSTTYYFEYGTTTGYGNQTSSTSAGAGKTPSGVSATLSGLTPGTLYHYRLVAINSAGSSQGSDMTFTASVVPGVVTVAATSIGSTSAQVNGTVNPNGAPTTYYFEYGTTTSYGTQTSSTGAGSGTSAVSVNAVLSTLTPGTLYHYRVVAINSAGASQGSDLTFNTTVVAPTVTTASATNIGATTAQANGTVNPNGASTTYYFEYGTTTSYGALTSTGSAGSGTGASIVSATLGGLVSGTLYHYRLVASNSAGTSLGSDMTCTTAVLPAAVTLAATNVGATTAQVNGTVNPNGVFTTYYFEYGTTTSYGNQSSSMSAGSGTSASSVSVVFNNLASGTLYHFRIVATNSAGTSQGSDLTFTTSMAPASVTLAASNVSLSTAQLNGSVNPNGTSTTYYFEYGLTTSYGTQTSSLSAGSGTSVTSVSVAISGLSPNAAYHYRLVATNSAGMSQGSDMVFITSVTPAVVTLDATNVGATAAQVNGTVNPNGSATTYYFEYGMTISYGAQTLTASAGSGTSASSVSASISGLSQYVTYHYRLVATNSLGTSQGSDMTFTTSSVPPDAVTLAATSVGATTAQVNGTVNPNGTSTTYYFEYGLTTSYGAQTGNFSAGSGTSANGVTASLGSLTIGTLYHYRLVATSTVGTSRGSDMTFTTSTLLPVVVTLAATNIGEVSAQLNGTVNPNGTLTTYYFEYGTTTSYGTQTSSVTAGSGVSAVSLSAPLNTLEAGTLYHFRLVATNGSGTSRGSDMTFTTSQVPAVVTLAATNVGATSVQLNGRVNPNGASTTYYFEYGTTTSYGTQTNSTSAGSGVSAASVSAALSGLTSGALFHYRLVATNSTGTSQGTDMTFTTLNLPPIATTFAATNVGATSALMNGTVNPSGSPTTYYFEYGTTTNYGFQTASVGVGLGSTAIIVAALSTDLTLGTTYHYRLVAMNSAGTSRGDDLTFTTAPMKPTAVTLVGTNIGATTAQLNGTVNPNGASTTYYFEYGPTSSYVTQTSSVDAGSGTTAKGVNAGLTNLALGTVYHFRLVATNGIGTSQGSDMTFTTSLLQPVVVTLAATNIGSTTAQVNGTVNPNGAPTTHYFEYGPTPAYGMQTPSTSDGSGTLASGVGAGLMNLVSGTLYHYRLVATNGAGTSQGSDMTFTTSLLVPVVVTLPALILNATEAQLTGTVNPNGASTAYYFEYGTTTNYGTQTTSLGAGFGTDIVSVSSPLSNLTPGALYHYRLVATNSAGTSQGSDLTLETYLGPVALTLAPTNIGVSGAQLNGTVNSNGLPTTYYFEYGTTSDYGSETSRAAAGSGTSAASVSVSITGLSSYQTYHYRLVATNLAATSRGSDMTFTTSALGPTAVTLAATSVSTTIAQLNGTVNPNGTPTTYYFEYGPTTSYGTQTSALSAGAGMSSSSVSALVSSLTPYVVYHFRLVATNSIGTFRGNDMTLMTGSSPTARTLAATNIAGSAAQLNGRVDPNGVATTCYFEYGTTIDYGLQTSSLLTGSFSGEISINAMLSNLASGTLYHYRFVATNIVGTSWGNDTTFIALALPAAVSTLSATSVGPTTAQLNGTVNPNGATTTYYFEYGPTDSYGSETSKMGAGSSSKTMSVSETLGDLTLGASYHFRLVATNIGGISRGSDVVFTTSVMKPSSLTLAATKITGTTAQLNGTVNPNGPSTTCFFEYGPTTDYGLQTSGVAVGSGMVDISVSASISGLTSSVLYHYRLVASSSAGTSQGNDMTFLAVPVGIAADAAVRSYGLSQNYPNPFNPSTKIRYQLPRASNVVLRVVNALGQVVATLDVGSKEAGSHMIVWTPMLPSGVYFYRLEAGDFVETKRMILLK